MSEEEVSVPGFKKHLLLDPQILKQLEEGYKGWLTENALLTKAARLAAKQHAILKSKEIPATIKKALLEDMAPDLQHWTRAVRRPTLPGGGSVGADITAEEADDFTQAPLQSVLMQLVKRQKLPPRRPPAIPVVCLHFHPNPKRRCLSHPRPRLQRPRLRRRVGRAAGHRPSLHFPPAAAKRHPLAGTNCRLPGIH